MLYKCHLNWEKARKISIKHLVCQCQVLFTHILFINIFVKTEPKSLSSCCFDKHISSKAAFDVIHCTHFARFSNPFLGHEHVFILMHQYIILWLNCLLGLLFLKDQLCFEFKGALRYFQSNFSFSYWSSWAFAVYLFLKTRRDWHRTLWLKAFDWLFLFEYPCFRLDKYTTWTVFVY